MTDELKPCPDCVYATERNTPAVRKGFAVGGYLKTRCPKHEAEFRTPTPAVEGDETHTKPVVSQNAPDLKHKPAAPQTGYSWTNSAPQDATVKESLPVQGAPETISKRLRDECIGNPATIPWPHRILHEAADALDLYDARIAALQAERDDDANQLDSARHTVDVLTARIAELEARLKLWEPPTTVETGSLPPTEKKP